MQALEWAVTYPDHVLAALPIATTARHSAQQIAFNEVGRQAIMADPDWNSGNYYDRRPPARGLAVARMVGHITYMSDESMREKFGRRLRSSDEFEVESYLKYRGYKFVDRFDANSYIYITRAMDAYDLTQHGSLPSLFENIATRFLVISFTSEAIGVATGLIFGAYHYTYETGHSGSSCVVGFSPRKANLVFYVFGFPGKADLLKTLGKHKGGLGQCLYINKLGDVDTAVLEEIVRGGVEATKKTWPVTAS
jgi:hypothetical protein